MDLSAVDQHLADLSRRVTRLVPPPPDSPSYHTWHPPPDLPAYNRAAIRTIGQCREALGSARLAAAAAAHAAPEREAHLSHVAHREAELERLRVELRGALQAAATAGAERHAAARAALLDGGGGARRGGGDDGGGDQSEAVASSLARSRRVMAEQVARMSSVAALIGEQDQLLRDAADEHRGVGGSVGRASVLLTRLRAQAVVDAAAMAASTVVFFAAAAYVVWARVPSFGLF